MKRKKPILLSIVLSAIMIVTSVLTVFAVSNPTIYADEISVESGSTTRIPIKISNNNGLAGVKLQFDYDATMLTPISVEAGDVFTSGLQDNIEGDAEEGSFNVYWASSNGDNVSANGILFYLNFDVKDNVSGKTQIDLMYDQPDTFDEDFNDVELNCQSISVDVLAPDLSNMPTLNLVTSKEKISSNEYFDVSVYASNISEEMLIPICLEEQYGFNLIEVSNYDKVAEGAGSHEYILKVGPDDNNTVVLNLLYRSFSRIEAGNYSFGITSTNPNVVCKGCSIDVESSFVADSSYEISLKSEDFYYYESGKKHIVPVCIKNNRGLMGYKINVKYDPNKIEPLSIKSGEKFPGNIVDNIGDSEGNFDVVWNSSSASYDNGVLFYLEFYILPLDTEETEYTRVDFYYSQEDTFDENYQDVMFKGSSFDISICPKHTYIENVIPPSCVEYGVAEYACKYCGRYYYGDVKDPIGHYYIYQSISDEHTMTYKCVDCDEQYSINANKTFSVWNDNNTKYINSKPTRKVINSQLLDVNHDNIINAKDYAMIRNLTK